MDYAIKILQDEAFKLGGEMLTRKSILDNVEGAKELSGMMEQFFGSVLPGNSEVEERFLELLKAIRVLRNVD